MAYTNIKDHMDSMKKKDIIEKVIQKMYLSAQKPINVPDNISNITPKADTRTPINLKRQFKRKKT